MKDIASTVRQSPPVDLELPYDETTVRGKTIIITGGASGFGEGFARRWGASGATIVIADINDVRGREVAESIKKETGNANIHYIHCDVTNWQSQVDLFHDTIKLSPTKGIDSVVINAGITDKAPLLILPEGLDADEPKAPKLTALNVLLIGALYTTHLALFYLPRNPRSKAADPNRKPSASEPDRHIMLIGSLASFLPLVVLPLYASSKHAVLGLFRSLRLSSFVDGVRVNMLCPYFIDTPLLNVPARLALAGGGTGKLEDVVEAGTRLMADTTICGRALAVGPKVKVDENGEWLPAKSTVGKEKAIWECYADDYEAVGE